jgi:hypothetical protein
MQRSFPTLQLYSTERVLSVSRYKFSRAEHSAVVETLART